MTDERLKAPKRRIPIFVIVGPTATGKTEQAVVVAQALDAEIVGADSMQVYRHMNIGTATPTLEELRGIPHHMIDVVNPDEAYDVAAYIAQADKVIARIAAGARRVLLVGGTGLYVRVLLHGLQASPPPDPDLRDEITAKAKELGWPALHTDLADLDPRTARKLHPNDGVRILRAIEVVRQSGVPISKWQDDHAFREDRYPHAIVGLDQPIELLHNRINNRVDRMISDGFFSEVEGLIETGYPPSLKPMQGLGYKRMCEHLAGDLSWDEAVEKTKTDTRRLARRQRKWFNREPGLEWIDPTAKKIIEAATGFFAGAEAK